jgi:chitodextrinase
MVFTVPLAVFALIWPAPFPAPRDREYDFDCHDSGQCLTEASVPRPARPRLVRVARTASTSITLHWIRNRRASGYEVVADGRRIAVVHKNRFTFTGLACATRYRLVVRALGPNGSRSHRRTVFATTSACPPGTAPSAAPAPGPFVAPAPAPAAPPPVAADTKAPSAPTRLTPGTTALTSIVVNWTASTDNVGVAGYSVFVNGVRQPQGSTSPSFTFTGLTCGTSYTLGVQAFDAVGNASGLATLAARTAACPAPPPAVSCPSNPKQGVQAPGNLTVLDPAHPCHTATGVVRASHIEHDGDCHVNISVDSAYQNLLNSVNGSAALGQLITEVIPSHTLAIPSVGSRVSIVGTWVNDHSTGWNELHPVWSYQLLSGSTGAC